MKLYKSQFLNPEPEYTNIETAKVAIIPYPYEGGVSYGKGTEQAPDAVIDASHYLELYDEVLDAEPYKVGIATIDPQEIPDKSEEMITHLYRLTKTLIQQNKFIAVIGGDHSISSGCFKAFFEKHKTISVIQFDAHSDLRDAYEGSKLSHASVMARIREMTPHTLQLGIRSMSIEEAEVVKKENIQLYTMHKLRKGNINIKQLLDNLPDPVFITFDVDALDWSIVSSTGTPEPGGFYWDEVLEILELIFSTKNVIGFDIVELSANDPNSPFAVAKLLYKMLGFKFSLK